MYIAGISRSLRILDILKNSLNLKSLKLFQNLNIFQIRMRSIISKSSISSKQDAISLDLQILKRWILLQSNWVFVICEAPWSEFVFLLEYSKLKTHHFVNQSQYSILKGNLILFITCEILNLMRLWILTF